MSVLLFFFSLSYVTGILTQGNERQKKPHKVFIPRVLSYGLPSYSEQTITRKIKKAYLKRKLLNTLIMKKKNSFQSVISAYFSLNNSSYIIKAAAPAHS